jgi:hypothetical protein
VTFRKKTEIRCRTTTDEEVGPHEWIDRMSQPNRTSAMMYCTLSKASEELGR